MSLFYMRDAQRKSLNKPYLPMEMQMVAPPYFEEIEPQLIDLSKEELVDMIEGLKKEAAQAEVDKLINLVKQSTDKYIGSTIAEESLQNYVDYCASVILSQAKTIKELQQSNDALKHQRLIDSERLSFIIGDLQKIRTEIKAEYTS